MSAQNPSDPALSEVRPRNPTHSGGEGLYEPAAASPDNVSTGADATLGTDASLKAPLSEHVDSQTKRSLEGEQGSQSSQGSASSQGTQTSPWEFARRNHVPTLLAIGGFVWLLVALVRRTTERW